MNRLIATVATGLALFAAGEACAQQILLAKPQMTMASRQADLDDCNAILAGKPRDPAMVAATPALEGKTLGDGAIIVPYGLGVFGSGMVAGMLAQEEEVKARNICMRIKGYVVARLTRKELGDFRERLPSEQDGYIEGLLKSGRLAEATRPLVPALPEAHVASLWRIVPGSLKPEAGPRKREEPLATARAVFSKEARLNTAFVVEPGKLEVPAGATFFRSERLAPDLQIVEPAWCTVLNAAAGAAKAEVLCLVNGNDGYQVFVVKPKAAAPVTGGPRIDALATPADLALLDAPAAAPVEVTYAVASDNVAQTETLVATAAWLGAEVAVGANLLNTAPGVDKARKGKAPQPDIDAAPISLDIGGQTVAVSATGKGRSRTFEVAPGTPAAP